MMKKSFLCFLLLCGLTQAYANIVISGTRVIYPAEKKATGVQIKNLGSSPSLVQVWVDDGKQNSQVKTPFVLTPNVTRINGKTSQVIRIRYIGTPSETEQKQETLYYFNVLDVPPKGNSQLNLRTKLKFFYRPAKLPYPVEQAYDKVKFSLNSQNNVLTVNNPTPYYITYTYVGLQQDKKTLADVDKVDMLAPFSQQEFKLKQALPNANQVEWSIINDYGGEYNHTSPLEKN